MSRTSSSRSSASKMTPSIPSQEDFNPSHPFGNALAAPELSFPGFGFPDLPFIRLQSTFRPQFPLVLTAANASESILPKLPDRLARMALAKTNCLPFCKFVLSLQHREKP